MYWCIVCRLCILVHFVVDLSLFSGNCGSLGFAVFDDTGKDYQPCIHKGCVLGWFVQVM